MTLISSLVLPAIDHASAAGREKEGEFTKGLSISQERIKTKTVFISRPLLLDETIRDIIVFNQITSIQRYLTWLKGHVAYKPDSGQDTWSDPRDTLKKRKGDCEDLAFLSAAFLKVAGYNPKVIGIFLKRGKEHAICIFEEGGRYAWIDNFRLIKTEAVTLQELSEYFFNNYACYAIAELNLEKNTFDLIARRT